LWSQGDCGELIFYALLTIARDHIYWEEMEHIKACHKLTLDSVLLGHEPVLMCAFLWGTGMGYCHKCKAHQHLFRQCKFEDAEGEQAMVDFHMLYGSIR
jgi:hypothetical protein